MTRVSPRKPQELNLEFSCGPEFTHSDGIEERHIDHMRRIAQQRKLVEALDKQIKPTTA